MFDKLHRSWEWFKFYIFPDLDRDSNSSADNDRRIQSIFFIALGRAGSIFEATSPWLEMLEAANLDSS